MASADYFESDSHSSFPIEHSLSDTTHLHKKLHSGVHVISTPLDADIEGDYPDGGLQAWMVVLGAFCATFSSFGYINAWGAFQDYYQSTLLQQDSGATIAWIGSAQYSLALLPGLFVGRLFDVGHFHVPYVIASINLVVCTFLTAECKNFWQLLLCQGLGVGWQVSCGFLFGPTSGIVAHWFRLKRSSALGIVTLGSPLGGIVFPIAFRNLTVAVGFPWTMRIIALIMTLTLGIANLTMKRRLPPKVIPGGTFNLRQFRSMAFCLFILGGFLSYLGLYTVLTFINSSAPSQGIPTGMSPYLVSIASVGLAAGRVVGGWLADRTGPLTVLTPATCFAGVFTLIWPFVHGIGPLVAIILLYGIFSGAFAGLLLAVPITAFGDNADVGRRTGMCLTIFAFSALAGPPMSGALNASTGMYAATGICAGSFLLLGGVVFLYTRYILLRGRGWRGKV
ncbi:MFS general substrate transporter [Gloeopeniophorella convolvens]|nr:MFS general substrate transporter [Gloeopeniophorella convolvens]